MKAEEYKEIERRKKEGGTLWFIERKNNGQWFYYTFEKKDNLPCTCIECFPSGYPFKKYKDGWTKNPQEAQGYLTKDEANNAAFGYFATDEPIENLIVSEHEFFKPQ